MGQTRTPKFLNKVFFQKLGSAEFVLADSGYDGKRCIPLPPSNHFKSKKFVIFCLRHEAVNGRLNKFRVLSRGEFGRSSYHHHP